VKTAEGGKVFDVVIGSSVGVNTQLSIGQQKEIPEIADEFSSTLDVTRFRGGQTC
jgi:hypothetical protein